jgi:hypothetical protein
MYGSQTEYARHAGITAGRVTQLKTVGALVLKDGKVDFLATDEVRARRTNQEASRKGKKGGAPKAVEVDDAELQTIRLRREMAECRSAELKAQKLLGELAPWHEYEAENARYLVAMRDAFLSIRDRMAPVHGLDVAEAFHREILAAMKQAIPA